MPQATPLRHPLKEKHCWQIMTGSVIPPDCDTVIPYEEVSLTENSRHHQR